MEQLIEKAARDLAVSKYAIALTGAGLSTDSGIPDFRGHSDIPIKHPKDWWLERFLKDPQAWWNEGIDSSTLLEAVEKASPNPGHYALAELENLGILKCVITQNVDALHEKAGTNNLIEFHGSLLKLRCNVCGARFGRSEFGLEKLSGKKRSSFHCPRCGGALKTDSVAFGGKISDDVVQRSFEEVWQCDLMLICGTSAIVYPFAQLPGLARRKTEMERKNETGRYEMEKISAVKIIEVNAEPTPLTEEEVSDYLIQGQTSEILPTIVEEVKKLKK
jgi:NAD-dependent deacetylase